MSEKPYIFRSSEVGVRLNLRKGAEYGDITIKWGEIAKNCQKLPKIAKNLRFSHKS